MQVIDMKYKQIKKCYEESWKANNHEKEGLTQMQSNLTWNLEFKPNKTHTLTLR